MDGQRAVTIRHVKPNGEVTRRTIEIRGFWVSRAGHVMIRAWDRKSGEVRDFRLERVTHYTLHQSATLAGFTAPYEVEELEEDDRSAVWGRPFRLAA
jgi:predicted DNA-binding transcriptional regulator YafY